MRAELISVSLRQAARFTYSVVVALLIVAQTGVIDLARAATTCDTVNYDGFFLGPDGKTTYAVMKQPLAWQDAQNQAQGSGGRLVVITDQPQNYALVQNLGPFFTPAPFPSSGNKAWIGLYDPLNTAAWCMQGEPCVPMPQRFSWANGFSSFRNYSSGEPNGLCTSAERTINPDHLCYGEPWVAMGAGGTWSDEGNHGTVPITLKGIVEWPQQTLDCVKVATPPLQPPDLPVPDASSGAQWCTNSQQNNLMQCLDTTDGQKLCPLEQSLCAATCSAAGYAWNGQRMRCEMPPSCPGGVIDASSGACVTSAQANVLEKTVSLGTNDCPSLGSPGWAFVNDGLLPIIFQLPNIGIEANTADFQSPAFTYWFINTSTLQPVTPNYDIHVVAYDTGGDIVLPQQFNVTSACGRVTIDGLTIDANQSPYGFTYYGVNTTSYGCPSGTLTLLKDAGGKVTGGNCTASISCPQGGTFDASTGLCMVPGTPPSCPADSALPCRSIQGDNSGNTYCSLNVCQSTTAGWTSTDDTTSGVTDKTNDGPKAADGTCLGTIYLFNGNDMRCRLFDRWGMVNSYAKLIAQIVLAATGAGAALAAAMGFTGAMATAVINAAVQIATNVTIDAATGQLNTGTLIQAGVSLIAAGVSGYMTPDAPSMYDYNPYGSTTVSITDNGFATTVNDSLSSLTNPFQLSSYGQSVLSQTQYQQFMSQLSGISDQYSPAISQGMLANYSETRCCYPDKMSGGCEQSEFKEAGQAGNGACHVVGTYCASKMLSACMVSKQTSCCFSSKLARIIHEQGRKQLADFGPDGGWGSSRAPICRGFSVNEFQNLDFSAMDLSEFTADITDKMKKLSPLLQNYMGAVGQQTEGLLKSSPNLPQGAQ